MPQTDKIGVYPGLDPLEDVPLEATHVAAFGDNVYVTSWDKKTGNWEVFLARSTDNGETFGAILLTHAQMLRISLHSKITCI